MDGALESKAILAPKKQPQRKSGGIFQVKIQKAYKQVSLYVFIFFMKRGNTMEKKTPLYESHIRLGGKMTPFAGYLLPVQYGTGVIAEHMAVRKKAGLFDVSHMGELILSGPDALWNLNNLFTNDFTDMTDGRVRYSPMCNDSGGIVDDLIVCRISDDRYFIVVNAANREKDAEWIKARLRGNVEFEDASDNYAQLALQGPASLEILKKLTQDRFIPQKYYHFTPHAQVAGIPCLLSRTGYTGEDGFELYCAPEKAERLADAVLEAGKPYGLIPCGLGARDTLRLEAAMPLYGHEMDDNISPPETGLSPFVKMEKPDFIGKKALLERGEPKIARVGLKITGRGIAREHCGVYSGTEKVGHVTSGTYAPYLGCPIAMALLEKARAAVGTAVEIDVRGSRVAAEVVPLPFYKRAK